MSLHHHDPQQHEHETEYRHSPPLSMTTTGIYHHHDHHQPKSLKSLGHHTHSHHGGNGDKVELEDILYELNRRNNGLLHSHTNDTSDSLRNLKGQSSHNSPANASSATAATSSHHATTMSKEEMLLQELAKKEKDLFLAAEVGQALLDRNEELSRTNEMINEEYTRNLEVGCSNGWMDEWLELVWPFGWLRIESSNSIIVVIVCVCW